MVTLFLPILLSQWLLTGWGTHNEHTVNCNQITEVESLQVSFTLAFFEFSDSLTIYRKNVK